MANKRTLVKVYFQYKTKGSPRPEDYVQEERLEVEVPHGTSISALPFPAVGDTVTVSLKYGESGRGDYRVLTRHFSYLFHEDVGLEIKVNIVVTDVGDDEMLARIKE